MSLVKTASGSEEYYIQYAVDGGERPGEWMGEGAKRLGLSGEVLPESLRNLFKGLHPDGTKQLINLSAIRKDLEHVPAWDLTLSPPKDVSLLAGLFDDFTAKIEVCQADGVRAAVEYIENNASFTRRGSGGKRLERCEPIIACFNHVTSRNNDPQWHSHLLILNAGAHSDGFGTIVSQFLYDHQTAINGVYLAGLAKSLQRELGLTILARELKPFEPGDTFRIDGIPDNLRDFLSSRRAEILSARVRFGATTEGGSEAAALATRRPKTHVPLSILRPHWTKAAESIGVDLSELRAALRQSPGETESKAQVEPERPAEARKQEPEGNVRPFAPRVDARKEAPPNSEQLKHAEPEKSVSPRVAASIIEAVTRSAMAAQMPDPFVDRLIDQVLHDFDRKQRPEKTKTMASKKLAAENALQQLTTICDETGFDQRHRLDADDIKRGVSGPITSREADTALVKTLSGTGAVAFVEAKSGVDTNLFIEAMAREYKRAGFKVRAFTPTPAGASALQTIAGIQVNTVGQLLYRLKSTKLGAGLHHATQILRTAMDLPSVKLWKFDSRTVVVVTQAQSLRAVDLARIFAEAKSTQAKVVLLGSPSQIARREPQNAFSQMTERYGKAVLSEPAIQVEEWMKDAVSQVARGDPRGAFSQYVLANRLHLAKDQSAATVELANYWRTLPEKEQNGKTLIIADSARDARVLNKLAQHGRKKDGGLGLFMKQKVDGMWVRRGDRIHFRIGSKHHGFKAGDMGTIERIGLSGMRIRLDRTKWALLRRPAIRVDVPKKLYRGLTLGYALSSADAQGVTCDRALVLPKAGGEDLRGLLVQLSRAREDTRIFTTTRSVGEDIAAIEKVVRRRQSEKVTAPTQRRESPTETTEDKERQKPKPRHRMKETEGIRV